MNKNIDQLIEQALSAEDQALLASHSEPGYVAQALRMFHGPWTWVMWLVYAVSILAFFAAVYALWGMFNASDALTAVKWGVAAVCLLQPMTMCKQFMGTHLETNRMLREIKRLELQVSLLRSSGS